MTFITSYNRLKTLYEIYLADINGIRFTPRETDILACIPQNRGEKKIAKLLSISPRTVNTHMYNITNKLGVNSRDQIIDFIENSGKSPIVREYYLQLSLKSKFEHLLIEIAKQVNRTPFECYCRRTEALSLSEAFLQAIKKHLKLANITLCELAADKIESLPIFDLTKIMEEVYYHSILRELGELINSPILASLTQEFHNTYEKIKAMSEGKIDIPKDDNEAGSWKNIQKYKGKVLVSLTIILLLVLLCFYKLSNISPSIQNTGQPAVILQSTRDLEEAVALLQNETFTADNVTPEQAKHNHNLIKKVEKILAFQNTDEVQKYFSNMNMPTEVLVNYLYHIQSLAVYYLHNRHDATEARKILLYGKSLIENYINSRSSIKNDFNDLSNAEIYSELQIANDLPQLYTRLLYTLGRTYIYDGSNLSEGKKYFELVKYLGKRLQLFEGYLGEACGALIIDKELAELDIQKGNINRAKNSLKEIIKAYTVLRTDSNCYINNYKPANKEQQLIVPKDHTYTFFDCGTRIVVCYGMLLTISQDSKEIEGYIINLAQQLQGHNNTAGLFELTNKIPSKKVADIYNILGSIILKSYTSEKQHHFAIKDDNLRTYIARALQINSTSHLELAEALFEAAKNISRNSDFTKADSYQGLAKVYQLKLKYSEYSHTGSQKTELQNNLKLVSSRAELLNKSLNRKAKSSILQD